MQKYIYIADASADASLPRFLENDASASPLRATLMRTLMMILMMTMRIDDS